MFVKYKNKMKISRDLFVKQYKNKKNCSTQTAFMKWSKVLLSFGFDPSSSYFYVKQLRYGMNNNNSLTNSTTNATNDTRQYRAYKIKNTVYIHDSKTKTIVDEFSGNSFELERILGLKKYKGDPWIEETNYTCRFPKAVSFLNYGGYEHYAGDIASEISTSCVDEINALNINTIVTNIISNPSGVYLNFAISIDRQDYLRNIRNNPNIKKCHFSFHNPSNRTYENKAPYHFHFVDDNPLYRNDTEENKANKYYPLYYDVLLHKFTFKRMPNPGGYVINTDVNIEKLLLCIGNVLTDMHESGNF